MGFNPNKEKLCWKSLLYHARHILLDKFGVSKKLFTVDVTLINKFYDAQETWTNHDIIAKTLEHCVSIIL